MFLFTYGTLKRGLRNSVLLAGSNFVKETVTKPLYKLYDCGPYPCLVEAEKGKSVRGEIYEIDAATLARLDRLEGIPFLYDRKVIKLENFPFETIAYFYQQDVKQFVECDSWPTS